MLNVNPRMRPSTEDLLKDPLIRKKMSEFGYLDIEGEQAQFETLINTIIVPRNLKQLHK